MSTAGFGRLGLGVLAGAVLIGALAAVYYARTDLTLSHYDARAHLVVARRIVDSLTPGWRQIGAVWLPLPHLLNLPLVQWDWAYRTGYPSVALSIGVLGLGLAALSVLIRRRTGSQVAALAAPAVILFNPNLLYLQSTPMTEPLLVGFSLIALYCADRWMEHGDAASRCRAGLAIAALALTRYEGWLVAAALVAFVGHGRRKHGVVHALGLLPYLLVAIAVFLLLGRGSTGVWFVSSGFFVPDPESFHQVRAAFERVWHGTEQIGGSALILVGAAGMCAAAVAGWRGRMGAALPLVLLAAVVLPLYAFYQGHPFRIRYMVPVVVALGALSALAIAALPRRLRVIAAVGLVAATVWQRTPLDPEAPMVLEAQWETPFREGRTAITRHLDAAWDGTPILASMGSLGHYMQEASRAGFDLADFVHEGNGDLWTSARARPADYVRWVLIEERAEGGDELAARARADAAFLAKFDRVAEGGGLVLYRGRSDVGSQKADMGSQTPHAPSGIRLPRAR